MAELIVGQDTKAVRARIEEADRVARISAWSLMGWVGFLFVLVGGGDLALAVWPVSFRDPTWEFGTAVTVLNGMPVLVLGLSFSLISGICLRRQRLTQFLALVFASLAIFTLTASFLLITTAPVALSNAPNPIVLLGIRKAIAKGSALGVLYTVAFAWLAFKGWRPLVRV